jgi:hypothetical protein
MDITTLIAGPLGGVLGLAGAMAQKWLGMKEAQQNHAFRMEELELGSKIDLQKADIALRGTIEDRAGEAFSKAVDAQAGLKGSTEWVQDALALFRPGITLLLWVSSMVMSVAFYDAKPELLEYMTTATFSMFTVSIGYWFGVRTYDKNIAVTRAVK